MMASPSKSYVFPPPSPERRISAAHQRASTTGMIRQRRSSPLLHEIQGPSRRLSSHQVLLLTPFGGPVPRDAMGAGTMARGSSSMGGPRSSMPHAALPRPTGMGPQISSVGVEPPISRPLPQRFNTRHQSLIQPVNPSPLSQPMATIQSGSEQSSASGGSSQPLSRDHSASSDQGESRDELGPLESTPTTSTASVVPMMRSNSLPVLTLRELDAMKDKDGELGIARGTHWAWVSNDDEGVDASPELPPMVRSIPPSRPFAFQDPFAPLGTTAAAGPGPSTLANHAQPSSTAPDYHYSPTDELRRMSEAASPSSTPWSAVSPMDGRSRHASVVTVTAATSATPIAHFSPPLSTAATFNSRASMSAIDQDQTATFGPSDSPGHTASSLPTIRPRILRYKTSPARFTGLGLDIVVKSQTSSSGLSTVGVGKERRRSSGRSVETVPSHRRRSSQISIEADQERRRSSGTSASSAEGRKGTWAVIDVVDTLSTTDLSLASASTSSVHSLRSNSHTVSSSPRESVYTIEHVSSRSSATASAMGKSYHSLPSRKGKGVAPAFAFETVTALEGFTADPLAFPRRGSLAVLSQTALGPWAAKASSGTGGEELLGAPKGDWQERRGSWAEGWAKK